MSHLSTYDLESMAFTLGKASRNGRGWVCCCPAHDDHDPSLAISLGDQNQILLYCHRGCSFEEVLKALQRRGILPERSEEHEKTRYLKDRSQPNDAQKLAYIAQLWKQSLDPTDTPVSVYLNKRLNNRLTEIPPTLRYLPHAKHTSTKNTYPCMLAFVSSDLPAVHRTFLNHDGTGKAPVEQQKMMLGQVQGGSVRLAPASEELMIAEGIETALTLQIMLQKPAWAALSATNMHHLILPPFPLAQTLYIAQDNDEEGQKGALKLADKAWAEGRTVHILQPPHPINDFNDLLFDGEANAPTRQD